MSLLLNSAVVANRCRLGGDIGLRNATTKQYTKIKRDNQAILTCGVDAVYQKGKIYRFRSEINTTPGDVVVITLSTSPGALQLDIIGTNGHSGPFITTEGQTPSDSDANLSVFTSAQPDFSIVTTTEALSDIVFKSSDTGAALFGTDGPAVQGSPEDYRLAILSLMYRNTATTVQLGEAWSKTINVGPLDIVISFDISKLEGSVSAQVLGLSLGTATFSKAHPVDISVNALIAKAWVKVSLDDDDSVWLEADVSAFGKSAHYGPTKLFSV